MQLPKLARMLDRVPSKTKFHLHVDKLLYIDRSCLDFLATWTNTTGAERKYRDDAVGEAGREFSPTICVT
jgi:hypothetical protein